jgi:hypothetical protein
MLLGQICRVQPFHPRKTTIDEAVALIAMHRSGLNRIPSLDSWDEPQHDAPTRWEHAPVPAGLKGVTFGSLSNATIKAFGEV